MYLIHVLAKKLNISTDSIRFYEKKGLLKPTLKAENRYRYYDDECLKKLIFIKNCRSLDMSIQEIQQLLLLLNDKESSCQSVDLLVENHIEQIEDKIKQLNLFKQHLHQLRNSCPKTENINNCQIIKNLENITTEQYEPS